MKLFQQLLVAPAALGLLAPLAVDATRSAQAADINVDAMAEYAPSKNKKEQVTSITQFSDVYPTDWAYQALSSLIERYGCVAGYPNGTFRGNRAMTRYEAAALLNACLDRITEITDELRRLIMEFERELAIIRGRVDGIEARVGELEATQFSTTTKLKGVTYWTIGANKFKGGAKQGIRDALLPTNASALETGGFVQTNNDEPIAIASILGLKKKDIIDLKDADFFGGKRAKFAAKDSGATNFGYDLRLHLDTSFTGKDLLRTRLRSGNYGQDGNPYGGSGYNALSALEFGYGSNNSVEVDRLYYSFPVGGDFTIVAGPRVRMDDMLPVWPAAYPADMTIDFFTYAGAPGVYNLALGGGAGFYWQKDGFSISSSYLSVNANEGNAQFGGLATDGAASSATTQLAYAADNWGLALGYTYASSDNGAGLYGGNATPLANFVQTMGVTNAFGVSVWWMPEESGWIPSISTGWGLNSTDNNGDSDRYVDNATSQSWYVGLQWDDVFMEGNSFGMAVGQPTFVTSIDWGSNADVRKEGDSVADGNFAFEWWYKFQVTDNISITPTVYYFSRPYGELTNGQYGGGGDASFTNLGTLVKTTFSF